MTTRLPLALIASALIACPVLLGGCETSHQESTKQNLFGGTTHQETTTTQNPITGNTSVESSKTVTH